MPHLTPQRAYMYDKWIYPWTVGTVSLWILFQSYAPPVPQGGGWPRWLGEWLEMAAATGLMTFGQVLDGNWEMLSEGWVVLVVWVAGTALIKRISRFHNWTAHRCLAKRTAITVTPDAIAFNGQQYENAGAGQLVVMQHRDLGMETMRDQSRREAGKKSRGKWRYFQNAFEVVMPYHGQPVVITSIYGNKLAADRVAARIMLARRLAVQGKESEVDADEFGPSPSLPDEDEEAAAETAGSFWRRMGGRR